MIVTVSLYSSSLSVLFTTRSKIFPSFSIHCVIPPSAVLSVIDWNSANAASASPCFNAKTYTADLSAVYVNHPESFAGTLNVPFAESAAAFTVVTFAFACALSPSPVKLNRYITASSVFSKTFSLEPDDPFFSWSCTFAFPDVNLYLAFSDALNVIHSSSFFFTVIGFSSFKFNTVGTTFVTVTLNFVSSTLELVTESITLLLPVNSWTR